MKSETLSLGFIPLVDFAPLAVAHEIGFAEEEGLSLDLRKAPSWSTLRDWLAIGLVDAAHMLSPVPVASALSLGGSAAKFDALSVLSVNGNVIGVSNELAEKMPLPPRFGDARSTGQAFLNAAGRQLRIGVPFLFSMHAELLHYWLGALGSDPAHRLEVRTIPPPLMAEALAKGEIDAFCVGEPWGSMAVETGAGSLILPGKGIWEAAPEKVLAVRNVWADENPDLAHRLIRTVWRAGRWLENPRNRPITTEILSRQEYLDTDPELLDRALGGHFVVTPKGDQRSCSGFVRFHGGAVGFPWRSQAAWIASQLASRLGFDPDWAKTVASQVYRTDLYRDALSGMHVDLPGASEKVEGAISQPTEVASASGTLILSPDLFFDRRVFDPE